LLLILNCARGKGKQGEVESCVGQNSELWQPWGLLTAGFYYYCHTWPL